MLRRHGRIGWCLALITAVLPAASVAGPYQTEPLLARPVRVERASQLLEGFANLRRALPTLSPAETQWVEREAAVSVNNDGSPTPRYFSLVNSREWALGNVAAPLQTVEAALKAIRSPTMKLDEETLHWAVVSATLSDLRLWYNLDTLIEKGVLDAKALSFIGGPFPKGGPMANRELLAMFAVQKVRMIMSSIVIPVLND